MFCINIEINLFKIKFLNNINDYDNIEIYDFLKEKINIQSNDSYIRELLIQYIIIYFQNFYIIVN